MIAARDLHLWERDPVRTEAECYFALLPTMDGSRDALYVAYPWAACLNGLGKPRPPLVPPGFGECVFTVCQHIRFRELVPLFKETGISVVFTPHARESEPEIDGVRILGFPHWPANYYRRETEEDAETEGEAEYRYSFIGAATSAVRRVILARLGQGDGGFVKLRSRWHFDDRDGQREARKAEYEAVIGKSDFLLCPRGTGPSSLRIWEALASGRIPVLVADDLRLPEGIPWEECSLRFAEGEVEAIPERLGGLDRATIRRMRAAAREAGKRVREDFAFAVKEWLAPRRFEVWMTPEEREFVESYLSPEHTVLEWGAGGSTVEFAPRVARYVSIEHDAEWFGRLWRRTRSEDLYLVETPCDPGPGDPVAFEDYIRFPARLGLRFDRVLIDGRCRVACAAEVLKAGLLAEGGLVLLHDWSRERYREVLAWYDIVDEIRSGENDQKGIVALRPKETGARAGAEVETEGEGPIDTILWESKSDRFGLGDRLRGIATGAFFATLQGRHLRVKWTPCDACPALFSDLFEESPPFSTFSDGDGADGGQYRIRDRWDFQINLMPKPFRDAAHRTPGFFRMVPALNGPDKRLSDAELFPAWQTMLRSLVPKPHIAEHINALVDRLRPESTLGVHLRRTDVMGMKYQRITRENVERYDTALWLRINEQVASGGFTHLYLATDDRNYFLEWREKLAALPVEVVYFEQSWGPGLRQTPLEGVVVDLYLMARCRLVLASASSSLLMIVRELGGQYELVEPLPR